MLVGVLQRVGKVVHRVDAPGVARVVVVVVGDAVNHRVTHVHVAAGHVNSGAEHSGTFGIVAAFHGLEECQILLHRGIAVGGGGAGSHQIAALLAHRLAVLQVHIGQAVLDEVYGALVVEIKDIGGPVQVLTPVETQPVDIFLDGVDEFDIFLAGVGVIKTQVTHRPEVGIFLGKTEIQTDGLGVADVQITVRLRGETGNRYLAVTLGQVPGYHVADEVFFLLCGHARDSTHKMPANQAKSGT